jgi:hypothetical protein
LNIHADASSDESWTLQEHRKKRLEGRVETGAAARRQSRRNLLLMLYHYWHRLLGTAVGWFAWDFYYCALLPTNFSNACLS